MTIDAVARTHYLGVDAGRVPSSAEPWRGVPTPLVAVLNAAGWGQEVTNGGTITGPAPLAVWLNARHSTSPLWADETEAFRKMACHFDFGYDAAGRTAVGNWTHSGAPKWRYIGGPITGHVFETPGTYYVRVKVGDGTNTNDAMVTVEVQNPDTIYSGTNTVCLTMDGSTTGGPAGCQYVHVNSAWPAWLSNRRYLLKRGQNFTARGTLVLPRGTAQTQIGAFGSGAKPLISALSGVEGQPLDSNWYSDRLVFDSLELSGGYMSVGMQSTHLLYNKVDSPKGIVGTTATIYTYNTATAEQKARLKWNRYITLHDCNVDCVDPTDETNYGNALYFFGVRGMVLGGEYSPNSQFGITPLGAQMEHSIRATGINEGCIQHVYAHNASESKLHLKLHSGGGDFDDGAVADGDSVTPVFVQDSATHWTGEYESPYVTTRWAVVGYIKTASGDGTDPAVWSVTIAPQNSTMDSRGNPYESPQDIIMEFHTPQSLNGSGGKLNFTSTGKRHTYRNATTALPHGLSFGNATGLVSLDQGAHNGPYYADATAGTPGLSNGATATSIASLVDPGQPAGAA